MDNGHFSYQPRWGQNHMKGSGIKILRDWFSNDYILTRFNKPNIVGKTITEVCRLYAEERAVERLKGKNDLFSNYDRIVGRVATFAMGDALD